MTAHVSVLLKLHTSLICFWVCFLPDIITCMNTKITVFQDEMPKDINCRILHTLAPTGVPVSP